MGRAKGNPNWKKGVFKETVCKINNCPYPPINGINSKQPNRIVKGYCPTHYNRYKKHGNPEVVQKTGTKLKGYTNPEGYLELGINGKKILAHRIRMMWHIGRLLDREEIVDHINGNRSDNRIENLRIVDYRENARNKHHCNTCTCWEEIDAN